MPMAKEESSTFPPTSNPSPADIMPLDQPPTNRDSQISTTHSDANNTLSTSATKLGYAAPTDVANVPFRGIKLGEGVNAFNGPASVVNAFKPDSLFAQDTGYSFILLQPASPPRAAPITFSDNNSRTITHVPENVVVELGHTIVDASMRTYATGSEAVDDLKGKSTLGASYQGLSVNLDAGYGVYKELNSNHQYSIWTDNRPTYTERIKHPASHLNPAMIARAKSELLKPWDPDDAKVISSYFDFFNNYGTHIITSMTYGWRYSLVIECDRSNSSTNKNFNAAVKAAYAPLAAVPGKPPTLDIGLTRQKRLANFKDRAQMHPIVCGGDSDLSSDLVEKSWILGHSANPDELQASYRAWCKARIPGVNDVALTLQFQSIHSIYSVAESDDTLRSIGQSMKKALAYLACARSSSGWLTTSSSCATMRLLSPNARFGGVDGALMVQGRNKMIKIVLPDSANQVTAGFEILNDGSPVQVEIEYQGRGRTTVEVVRGGKKVVKPGWWTWWSSAARRTTFGLAVNPLGSVRA